MGIKGVILSLLIVLGFAGINSLGRFYMTEPAIRGQEFNFYTVVRNPTNDDLDDVRVKLFIYDLGITLYSDEFDINDNRHKLASIHWIPPESICPGTYITRISAGNDYYADINHVYLTIA